MGFGLFLKVLNIGIELRRSYCYCCEPLQEAQQSIQRGGDPPVSWTEAR